MNSVIKVDQTLHGYANGHQLIASSVNLNAEDKRQMDELSDLSGICEEKQFIDYYTGYPLDGGKKYVIAKTWYAYEKQRPGCVWTHSLILNIEDVEKISYMKQFEKLFVRPETGDYGIYTDTLMYHNIGDDNIGSYDTKKMQYVIYTIFSSIKPRYVRASEIHLEEDILFMLKNMPYKLLQNFSFCTMAYDTRKIGNEEFSYQIIDRTKRYKIDRNTEGKHICEEFLAIKKYPLWVCEYCKYIQQGCLKLLHDFMKKYGEAYQGFSEYSAMARLYFAVKNTENITLIDYFKYADIVRKQIDNVFCEKTMELILDGQLDIFAGKEYEIWNMLELRKIKLKVNYQKKLNEKTINDAPEKLYPILQKYIAGQLSLNTKQVIENLIMELKPEQLRKVSGMNENICVVLISQNSKLILAKDIWKESKKFQQTILSASNRMISDEILGQLIYVILKYDKETISDSLYTIYGAKMIPHVYCSLKKDNIDRIIDVEQWKSVLLMDQKRLLKNILCFQEKKTIKNLFIEIDTYQNLYAIDKETWKKLYKSIETDINQDVALAAQFLPVILKTDYLDEVLKEIIIPIYRALENNSMDFEQWNKIQFLLPEVEAYQSWDRCLRVRLALNKKGVGIKELKV